MNQRINRALISVSDKTNIVEFATELAALNVEILSTGGTATLLRKNNIPVIEVADYTGFAEMMDGRVKTLHPKIHGALLGRRQEDSAVMEQHGIIGIDLLVVNLYPFSQTIAQADCSLAQAIENIDIGGPAMLRSGAKNHDHVAVVCNNADYQNIIDYMQANNNCLSAKMRFDLACKAFAHTSLYDGAIVNYLTAIDQENAYPNVLNLQYNKQQTLRYGENPHQTAAFYSDNQASGASIANAYQHQGKELSYNNIADSDAALECVKQFSDPACVIVKHANPCGVAVADEIEEAYARAFATDQESAFGGIIAFNRQLDDALLTKILKQQFVEVIIAPSISEKALIAAAAKPNVRILSCGEFINPATEQHDFKKVNGGMLVQQQDQQIIGAADLKIVSKIKPSPQQLEEMLFAWKVAKFVKSNAIVYAANMRTIGIGAGQMSRVNSARIAAIKAEHAKLEVAGCVMASDAFFPFRDGIDNAAKVGIKAVIQPGGSMRDGEVIQAANEHNMAMVFTNMRHFRH